MRSVVSGVVGFALGGGIVGGAMLFHPADASSIPDVLAAPAAQGQFWKEGAPPVTSKSAPAAPDAPAEAMPSLRGLIKTVSPSVVNIYSTKTMPAGHGMRIPGLPPGLNPFFQGPGSGGGDEGNGGGDDDENGGTPPGHGGAVAHALGSGFIVTADGYIVTNNHVVQDSTELRVKLSDGREMDAKLIGRDPQLDVGLIKIDAKDLPVLTLGDSDSLETGDWVVAVGNPFGLDHSASVGIISGKGREIGISDRGYDALLQTDAAINPGNSGGPLFNLKGEVVGINTAIVPPEEGAGIGFAIPIDMAKDILPDLKEHGKAIRGQLGVALKPVTQDAKDQLGLTSTNGALIERVVSDSPAAKAGLKAGDVIVKFNGTAVADTKQLQRLVTHTRPGSDVEVSYVRDGKTQTAHAKLSEFTDESVVASSDDKGGDDTANEKIGVAVSSITPESMNKYHLKSPDGVLVVRVAAGSPADNAGIEPGDVIREINRKKISSPGDLKAELTRSGGKSVFLLVDHQGEANFIQVSPNRSSMR